MPTIHKNAQQAGRLTLLILYFAGVFAVFDGGDFAYAALVTAAGEVGGEPDFDILSEHYLADEVAGNAEDIGIVVLTRDLRVELVVAKCGADASYLVGGDAHADACAANEDCAVNLVILNGLCGDECKVGVIDGIVRACAVVDALMAHLGDLCFDLFLGFKSSVIACYSNFHLSNSLILFSSAFSMSSAL